MSPSLTLPCTPPCEASWAEASSAELAPEGVTAKMVVSYVSGGLLSAEC